MPDYGALLTFNGDPDLSQFLDETPRTVTLAPDTRETRCVECGDALRWVESKEVWVGENGDECCEEFEPADPDAPIGPDNPAYGNGPHQPQRMPFEWLDDATIQLQPPDGGATEWVEVSITVLGGTVKLRVEHVIDEGDRHELAGKLILHMTQPGDNEAPTLLQSGTGYLIG